MNDWQNELERLDREFATKRISLESYRRLRDDLLARASASMQPETESSSGTLEWFSTPPRPGPQPTDGPVDAPSAPPPPAAPSEPLPVAPPAPEPVDQPAAVAAPTATVPPVTVAPAAGPAGPPPGQGDAATLFTPPPPTARSGERPVVVESAPPGRPGGTVGGLPPAPRPPAGDDAPRHRRRRTVPILVTILVAALAAAWIAYFEVNDSSSSNAASSGSTPTSSAAPGPSAPAPASPQALLDLVATPPGQQTHQYVMAIDTGVQLGLYSQAEATALTHDGVTGVVYRSSQDGNTSYAVVLAPTTSPTLAGTGVTDLTNLELGTGGTATDPGPLPRQVSVVSSVGPAQGVYQAVYRVGTSVVWVRVQRGPLDSAAALAEDFQQVVESVLRKLPAN